jgi:replicative DNA helicase
MKDRIPPQSLEMEQATLGAMLIDRAAIETAGEILRPEDFYRDAHRQIFEAILSLAERDEPVDILTLQEALKLRGNLEQVGGAAYLAVLMDSTPAAARVEAYARVVEEKSILRRLLHAAGEIQGLAHAEYSEIQEVVDRAERSVFGVAQRRIGSYFTPMKPLVADVLERLEHRSENRDATTGLATPFDDFNYMTAGLQPGELIIVAARPSMGKTSLAMGMGQYAAVKLNKPVAVFSLEMSKEQLCMRMICSEAMVDASHLRTGFLQNAEWAKVGHACSRLADAPMFIDDTPDISALEMRAKCRRLKAEHGLSLIIVDYLQLMRSTHRVDNRTQEIGEIARSLKALAREMEVPVVALSQLSRAVETRKPPIPMLSDLRESGSIEAEADLVVFIYREDYYKRKEAVSAGEEEARKEQESRFGETKVEKAELIIAKQRNGPTGTVDVAFLDRFTRFDNYVEDYGG